MFKWFKKNSLFVAAVGFITFIGGLWFYQSSGVHHAAFSSQDSSKMTNGIMPLNLQNYFSYIYRPNCHGDGQVLLGFSGSAQVAHQALLYEVSFEDVQVSEDRKISTISAVFIRESAAKTAPNSNGGLFHPNGSQSYGPDVERIEIETDQNENISRFRIGSAVDVKETFDAEWKTDQDDHAAADFARILLSAAQALRDACSL